MTDYSVKIKDLLKKMSLEQKAALCDGEDFWNLKSFEELGIPSIMVSDGPHGLRKRDPNQKSSGLLGSVPAVCYPTAATTACSWDRELLKEMGEAIALECKNQGIAVVLGPGVNIKRSPLCGRNFEYFSEDPLLTGELATAFIQGVQSKGIGTSIKHYAVNNQETRRMTVDSVVDERALREIYLTAFEIAVKKSSPATIMSAYNRLDGEFCTENNRLQNSILRDEWGYKGVVVSDWGAVNERDKGLAAGNDLEMPFSGGRGTQRILQAIKAGTLKEEVLDKSVERLLRLIFAGAEALSEGGEFDSEKYHDIARRIGGESMVLLKNEENILPLQKGVKAAVIGELAKTPRYQGSGSSRINPTKLDNAFDCLTESGVEVSYSRGYSVKTDKPDKALIEQAAKAASQAEVALVFIGLTDDYESEGFDRAHMRLPDSHNKLVEAVCAANPNTVVILAGGSPVEMPWIDKVKGLLNSYLGGQAGAGAIADILTGAVNPSGKLAESYPFKLEDTSCFNFFPGNPATVEYRESVYIGYRYYEKVGLPVLFPFGFGLSYTEFEYSDIACDKTAMKDDETLIVSFKVKNVGSAAGAQIAQIYVADSQSTVFRPEKELKGFEKVFLNPGEEKEISVTLDKRAFAFYDTDSADWRVESGSFEIAVGASSADIRLKAQVEINSTFEGKPLKDLSETLPDYYSGTVAEVSAQQFETLLGRPLPPTVKDKSIPLDLTDNFENAAHTKWGGRINRMLISLLNTFNKGPNAGMMNAVAVQTPFRSFIAMSGGLASNKMIEGGLLRILNGDKPFKGFLTLLGGVPRVLIKLRSFLKKV